MRRSLAGSLAVLALALGYGALDVFDVAPGILTRDRPVPPASSQRPTPSSTTTPTVMVPTVDSSAEPLQPVTAQAPIPSPAAVARTLAAAVTDPALGGSPGIVVRDAFTGQMLFSRNAGTPRVAASTGKLLTALAVSTTLDPRQTFPTTVVAGSAPGEVVLVAGGDTMLAKGKGVPTAVEGRAGLADLAGQVATALQSRGAMPSVTVRLDTSYARGPRWAPSWSQADVAAGYTGGVSMLGLAGQRAVPGRPAPRDPESATGVAFAAALSKLGIPARLAPTTTRLTTAAPGATELGRVDSAPASEVLALALDESDNALTETMARIATVKAGGVPTFEGAVAFVRKAVTAQGVDLSTSVLKDTSGLASGQKVTPQALSDALQLGADGRVPAMQDVVAALPVAGLTGTLEHRFMASNTRQVAGLARAKTGTLTGASALAGTVIDSDGRVLSYVVLADGLPSGVGTLNARAALDRFVAVLASCGCR